MEVTRLQLVRAVTDIAVSNAFEPPRNTLYVHAAMGQAGCALIDWSDIATPTVVAILPFAVTRGLDMERVKLDLLCDPDGVQIKDVSHKGARTFDRAEMRRILGTKY